MATGSRPGFEPSSQNESPRKDPVRRSEQLTIRQHRDDGVLTLHIGGVVDSITAPELATRMEIALASGTPILIVDMTDVEFLAAAGIDLLIEVQRLTENSPVQLRVVADGATTYRPLRILGVDRYLQIFTSAEEARN